MVIRKELYRSNYSIIETNVVYVGQQGEKEIVFQY
jgi:hypothetical protein